MKKVLFFFISIILISVLKINAQDLSSDIARFKNGGMLGLQRFLMQEFRFRMPPDKNDVGRIFASFIITEQGNIDSIIIWNGINDYMEKESIRVLRLTDGEWIPAIDKGVQVKTHFNFVRVVTYNAEGEDLEKLYQSNLSCAKNKYEKGKIQKAIKNLDRAINYNPLNREVYELRANYKKEINDIKGYEKDLLRIKMLENSNVKMIKQEEIFHYLNKIISEN